MGYSTFDIVVVAPQIKKLQEMLVEAMKHEDSGGYKITNEEADAIGALIVEIADKLKK